MYHQSEFPFVSSLYTMKVVPFDGQYTFLHFITSECFKKSAEEAKLCLGGRYCPQPPVNEFISVDEWLKNV